jgi:RHS repeat-associated protein
MKQTRLYTIVVFMALLVVMMPVCFAQEVNLVMDANGNLVTGDGKFRVYNSLNQLSKVYNGSTTTLLLEEYVYHPVEERVLIKKVYNNNSAWKETVYYIDDNFVRVVNSSGSYDFTYVYHEGQLVAQSQNGNKLYIHGNHEGSSTVVTNPSGQIIENTSYNQYGQIVSGGSVSRFDYEGQEYDSVVGDYDFHFRKYKAEWGLFTQPDTLISNVYDPQSLNRYMFERANPYKYKDPDGHLVLTTFGAIVITILCVSLIVATILTWQETGEFQGRGNDFQGTGVADDRKYKEIDAMIPDNDKSSKKKDTDLLDEIPEIPNFEIEDVYDKQGNLIGRYGHVNEGTSTKYKTSIPSSSTIAKLGDTKGYGANQMNALIKTDKQGNQYSTDKSGNSKDYRSFSWQNMMSAVRKYLGRFTGNTQKKSTSKKS